MRPVQDLIAHTEAFVIRPREKLETRISEARKSREDIAELETKIPEENVVWMV